MPKIQNNQTKPLRICYPFVGDSIGGAQVSTATLLHALPEEIDPLVIIHCAGPLQEYIETRGIAYRNLPLSQIPGRHPSPLQQLCSLVTASVTLAKFLRKERIDIVHTQDGRMHIAWGAAAALTRTAHVWHQRSPYAPSRIQDFLLKRATSVIAITEFAKDSLPAGSARRAEVIYNPVTPVLSPRNRELARQEVLQSAQLQGLGNDTLVVAAVGNLREVKQPMLLAEAVLEMTNRTASPVLLALFGDDKEGVVPQMKSVVAKSGNLARLVHLGFRHPIEDWLSGCDVLLATSKADAFGRSLVEAMAVGVPVVAVDAGGHSEIVTDGVNGILVADHDPEALAIAALNIAGDDNLRSKLIAGGGKRVKSFAPEHHVAAVTRVYRMLQIRA